MVRGKKVKSRKRGVKHITLMRFVSFVGLIGFISQPTKPIKLMEPIKLIYSPFILFPAASTLYLALYYLYFL